MNQSLKLLIYILLRAPPRKTPSLQSALASYSNLKHFPTFVFKLIHKLMYKVTRACIMRTYIDIRRYRRVNLRSPPAQVKVLINRPQYSQGTPSNHKALLNNTTCCVVCVCVRLSISFRSVSGYNNYLFFLLPRVNQLVFLKH